MYDADQERWLSSRRCIEINRRSLTEKLVLLRKETKRTVLCLFAVCEKAIKNGRLVDGQVTSIMDGITELREKILQLFGKKVSQIYYISSA